MSKGNKVIENPEVPGFEQNLPPPPPGLITPRIEVAKNASNGSQLAAVVSIAQSVSVSSPMMNPNFLPTPPVTISPQQQMPSSQLTQLTPIPWWIPTEADSQDAFSSHQWFDHNQKSCFVSPSLPPPPPPPPPPPLLSQESALLLPPQQQQQLQFVDKYKGVKRKNKDLDPAEDAERVASAQRELSALMKPLKCDLCNAVMNSTLQAKLHYDGKPHQKKVSMFLNQSVKKLKVEDGNVICAGETDDWNTYCSICKTWFTSQTDAAQHYAGKKHIKATTGTPKQKLQKKHVNSTPIDPTGRFGIGLSFQSENQNISPSAIATAIDHMEENMSGVISPNLSASTTTTGELYVSEVATYGAALRCDLCGVATNRFEQLETHKRGARHQKMLKLNGFNTAVIPDTASMVTSTTIIDYSIYRTPSGSYYCAPCNKSFGSENSFAQHVESKKHKNQVNPKSPVNQTTLTTSISATKKDKSKKLVYKTP